MTKAETCKIVYCNSIKSQVVFDGLNNNYRFLF